MAYTYTNKRSKTERPPFTLAVMYLHELLLNYRLLGLLSLKFFYQKYILFTYFMYTFPRPLHEDVSIFDLTA